MTDQERFVGVKAAFLVHAVWVPHDLEPPEAFRFDTIDRGDRGPLTRSQPQWRGRAECGQLVRGVVAGPNHGHDWATIRNADKCPRCAKKVDG